MEDQLTIEELEKKCNMFLTVEHDPKQKMDEDEFRQFAISNGKGVMYEERVQWLEKNGYEVTRENLLDANLPTVNP